MAVKETILVAGASGFIGSALLKTLSEKDYTVLQLVRHQHEHETANVKQIYWDPEKEYLEPAALGNLEETPLKAVICLSGAGIADKIWTQKRKETLESSRLKPLQTLIKTLETLPPQHRPSKLITASAVGYYGANASQNHSEITETSPAGTDFLAQLCQKWETAGAAAENLNIPVAHLRTGLVMHPSGGLLKTFDKLYRYGLGAQLGTGENWMPLITLRDHVRAICHVLETPELTGPVNLVGPNPVPARDFHQFMAERTRRPKWIKIPRALLHLAPEQIQLLALANQRVLPKRLEETGFVFKDADVLKAIEEESWYHGARIVAPGK
ncbi:TIGR01777 family oxidoreductase [Gleimia sp. 6138-11-ORH1]|uniref:TIGR01777 family oxidoreductase n=1 Tax=Gleimia sp. 6138-11-ORH1 TaxID=2973937 RepID=UPI0021679E9D|nr:TIGR01777 family oxidoreductase [Gleimia sp. 6138-11-ORH1]MCS4483922.1 TIGR01777 family oxidoreductase [Gleimia sp. 6138-11-ORH1]